MEMREMLARPNELEGGKEEVVWLIEARLFLKDKRETELFVKTLEDKGFHVETKPLIFEY